ncbi:FtsQ-type POTRA domain-containing protein [Streptomyces sp. WAC05374]|uniref:cell division protein FtsQ/DivIB n=1 Tax=Streptomyces sp. WAC05374 TaxID=2487420 RepID=UPI000F899BEF|nr:FtsQ-type POTRA domain-containing protein [Streptomyces sp. WAC05374]RST12776.1 FtsQ-type POTRA domain-containing protein [Streptomyces sp. WAC05374]TDF48514.1 FtsQ-type POTRA domain-containing protein [Streptomyces sp. WAC05374]TDF54930.1 FtsQ-type POTRA domain-containing protein [Streptomyces sp. WAC05374]TDF55448.1 FtsQ-type POTRA domain-containing protein [Streptomyces sp. WAC05374]
MAGPTTTTERGEPGTRRPVGARPKGAKRTGPSPARPSRLPGPRAVLLIVAALLVLASGVWLFYGSAWLRIEEVTTSGTRVLTPAEVRAAAAVPVGAPLVSVDTDDIEDRLRRALPRIDSVDVVRSWPHGVALHVVERTPVLLLEKGGKFTEVDANGVRFATVDAAKAPKGVPLLELTVAQSPSLRRFGADRLTAAAVGVAGDLPGPVAGDTKVLKVRSYDSITLELTGGRTVVWGSGEEGEAKARALTALMKAAPKAGHFDVSAPTAPAASRS